VLVRRVSSGWPYSAANPAPWPPAAAAAARGAPGMPAMLSTKGQLRPLARPAKAAAGAGTAARTVANEPAIELPPWRPVHPIGGALRNIFGPPAQS
jgi:hypothetical protein